MLHILYILYTRTYIHTVLRTSDIDYTLVCTKRMIKQVCMSIYIYTYNDPSQDAIRLNFDEMCVCLNMPFYNNIECFEFETMVHESLVQMSTCGLTCTRNMCIYTYIYNCIYIYIYGPLSFDFTHALSAFFLRRTKIVLPIKRSVFFVIKTHVGW